MTGAVQKTGEFTGRNVRWWGLALGVVCAAMAMFTISVIAVAATGAAAALLGIAIFASVSRPIGAATASIGLGMLVPSIPPTVLILAGSL